MSLRSTLIGISLWAGLVLAPLAWAVAMQLGLVLPHVDCASNGHATIIAAACAAFAVFAASALSWRAHAAIPSHAGMRTQRFIASLAGLTALLIGLAVLFQLAASVMLNACER